MKKHILCFIFCATIVSTYTMYEKPIPVPDAIDGLKHLGIDGEQIRNMCYIVKKVGEVIHGTLNRVSKQKTGKYTFNNTHYTIEQLMHLEKEKHTWSNELQHEFYNLLEYAKKDLLDIAEPFIEQGRSVKVITLQFLNHWAKMHHRENSFLLKWSNQKDGHETEAFQHEVFSFQAIHEFCVDLISFISDLIKSCPHAWEQFKAMKKK